jgi:hypothetical protein
MNQNYVRLNADIPTLTSIKIRHTGAWPLRANDTFLSNERSKQMQLLAFKNTPR